MTKTTYAKLTWDEQGQPVSTEFDDIYFSKTSGLDETYYVFLKHNNLLERFRNLKNNNCFVIGETGFGSGLNFLSAWQLFEEVAPHHARLHYISVEKYPLTIQDLGQALSLWDDLAKFSKELINQYVAIHEGYQNFIFANGRVALTLLVGDVHEQLPKLNAKVDAWFLDGFSPAKNPQMWTDDLFKQLARLSKINTTLATFTSAGFVRRGLQEAGFVVAKDKGFANKREMLYGHFQGVIESRPNRRNITPPWYSRLAETNFANRTAIVIGAGVAGASSAASLAARGWQVTVLERNHDIALEGSGNAQGILYLKLSAHQTLQSRLLIEGFGYTRRLLESLTNQGKLTKNEDWQDCGVLQLAFDDKEQKRQQQLAEAFSSSLLYPVDQQQANQLAGLTVNNNGLFFPEGCWVKPRKLCQALLDHPNIKVLCNQNVVSLDYQVTHWNVLSGENTLATADIVVLAGAADTKQFMMTNKLPIKAIRGQTTELPVTDSSQALSTIVCSDGYISPARDSKHCLGATFNFHAADLALSNKEHRENIQTLKTISLDLGDRLQVDHLDINSLEGRAAYRCTATDYLPLVGPIADRDTFLHDYQVLIKDSKKTPNIPCHWIRGLFLNVAHGSRGLITAPLCGEMLASWMENEPFPIEQDLMEACHPNRFYIRELKYFRRNQE
ncbi:bifunctional tRNA (5-methylaminomethyl-2-thiouridine)(34)-methyltransferase MnmD/FAD-dependent 5-carboxymethylaminomethyl-2-thiouridine(34) oxidoreductase MnmC [Entomomonas sp. E2T0]|uniref:bifunctional tRNA (5-methylaminomethyl-2-thiouridine)(34)-methyltransferase MnmD/FAD-dependent 5-carboxymethylaminomethyl-2-thiouridine(34) oxidoreductase MnmC n=1 Tax=Entomomonas sp. E2T0 TaxID=2930213 RepID=UPI002228123F|nr:bifunctional tRNA (5-methylaminomethyl-2-thiouridine)(34)-methyltransferase MnmD/FAD-dependent 5-carboxymethylaminomethyl-2-thiouridine(34) oxidoreductase MnmC [Entomomonas sp. E2T0]UYZ84261.1 bifunctional tRNA (5-methylaminomethyl-2-thiouridine)(34)-methyltransferase MnmD/FAD-dependent 5-carboxymethylaminomethyl-2-thiouridine(34) oxidoreductase MnmC [Entomomonas sp. E2T0]